MRPAAVFAPRNPTSSWTVAPTYNSQSKSSFLISLAISKLIPQPKRSSHALENIFLPSLETV